MLEYGRMKTYSGGVHVWFYIFLTSAIDGHPGYFPPWKELSRACRVQGQCEPQFQRGVFGGDETHFLVLVIKP